jgi:hypothetical protein
MKAIRVVDLHTRAEHVHPPVERIRFPLKTRWYLVTSFKPWGTWHDVWRNLVLLVRGRSC